ncbi:MAG: sigma-54-dependent Fis family transcriptional regulator [Gemmatimonadales bacterium]|nr:MAG: sigma-54-dependent Fis family transcriptional regulator [Gemmatimonadales bacterium]
MVRNFHRILVVDDDPTFRDVLEMRLQRWGYSVKVAPDAISASTLAADWKPHLVLSDVVMPEASGLELLGRLRKDDPSRPVILLTAHASVEMAVEAMKLGAVDFITKPLNYPNLQAVVEEYLRKSDTGVETKSEAPVLPDPEEEEGGDGLYPFIGKSPAMQEAYRLIRSAATSDASVLITGESGTGKELVARTLHRLSGRASGPFVAVNAAAIPRELMESEIFGHEKGAFTGATESRAGCFELADGGTLFLDEIGEMPKELQPKLLRVLDLARIRRVGGSREVSFDVRTLAATNRDPRKAVEEGVLREDLFFRLNVLHIQLPALRDREGDIRLLANAFVRDLSRKHQRESREFAEETLEAMEHYPWPGNVRELRNLVERAVVLSPGARIELEHLPPYVRNPERGGGAKSYAFPPDATVADAERELILRTLDETGNNKTETARRLGVSVRTIHNKLKAYGVER